MPDEYDLIVIGGGPGGYVAALRAAQLGMSVVCVDKRKALGGTCLNIGCIPSKALLDSSELFAQAHHQFDKHGIKLGDISLDLATMMKRKDQVVKELTDGIAYLFKKNKVKSIQGTGRLLGKGEVEVTPQEGNKTTLEARAIVLATGSVPVTLPGLEMDGKYLVSSTEALSFKDVPKRLLVVGAGYIGLEMGSVWSRLGAKVTVLEYLPRILPLTDGEIAKMVHKSLEKQGFKFHLGMKVTGATVKQSEVTVTTEDDEDRQQTFSGDRVLVAVGRKPFIEGLGLDEVGVEHDEKSGRVDVDERFRTNVEGIYAIGDLIHGPMLAHKAMEEGTVLAELLAGQHAEVNYRAVPSVIYTWPEVASVGPTEEELKDAGTEYVVGKFPFVASGRAKCMGESEGVVKILAEKHSDRLLAAHIFGPRASELIAECVTVLEFGGSAEDIARIMHSHPTLSESVAEAARAAAFGKALHA